VSCRRGNAPHDDRVPAPHSSQTLPSGPAPVPRGPPGVPVSLLTVGRFVDFPVSRGAKHSYDRTNAPPRKGPLVAKTKRLVVLVSGSGTNLQALLDAVAEAGPAAYGAEIVAVGADRDGIAGLDRATSAGDAVPVGADGDHLGAVRGVGGGVEQGLQVAARSGDEDDQAGGRGVGHLSSLSSRRFGPDNGSVNGQRESVVIG